MSQPLALQQVEEGGVGRYNPDDDVCGPLQGIKLYRYLIYLGSAFHEADIEVTDEVGRRCIEGYLFTRWGGHIDLADVGACDRAGVVALRVDLQSDPLARPARRVGQCHANGEPFANENVTFVAEAPTCCNGDF